MYDQSFQPNFKPVSWMHSTARENNLYTNDFDFRTFELMIRDVIYISVKRQWIYYKIFKFLICVSVLQNSLIWIIKYRIVHILYRYSSKPFFETLSSVFVEHFVVTVVIAKSSTSTIVKTVDWLVFHDWQQFLYWRLFFRIGKELLMLIECFSQIATDSAELFATQNVEVSESNKFKL